MPGFFDALSGLNLLPAPQVATLVERTAPFLTTDYALGDVEAELRRLVSELSGMQPDELLFVARLHSHGGLLEFLATFESMAAFDTQTSVVTNQMQGHPYESEIVTTLQAATRWLWPFNGGKADPKKAAAAPAAGGAAAGAAAAAPAPEPRFPSLRALQSHIVGEVAKLSSAAAQALIVVNLAGHVEELKVWFSAGQDGGGSGEVLSRIAAYMPSASFVSRSAAAAECAGGALVLEYSPTVAPGAPPAARQTLNPELLAEMVRGALLSQQDKDNTAEQRAALDGFVTAYHAAADVHAQRLHLESIGHPDFCGGDEEKSKPGSDEATLRRRAAELREAVKSWNREIGAAKAANRRLRLLDGPALLRFVQCCKDASYADVLPYVLLCFPEAMCERAALGDAVRAALPGLPPVANSASALRGPGYLARAVALVRAVAQTLGQPSALSAGAVIVDLDQEEQENAASAEDAAEEAELQAQGAGGAAAAAPAEGGAPRASGSRKAESEAEVLRDVQVSQWGLFSEVPPAHRCTPLQSTIISCITPSGARMTDDEVYRIVMQHVADTGVMPAPSQITWVAASTTPLEVTAFVMRAAAFPALRFAIVGVNKLAVPARESLMRAILSRRGRRARLALVFTESTGQTSLSLVMKV